MKTALHRLALRMGWYKDITKGMPLNICKTVFGATFFEGVYTARPIGELIQDLYFWGWSDGEKALIPSDSYKTECSTEQEEQEEMVFFA